MGRYKYKAYDTWIYTSPTYALENRVTTLHLMYTEVAIDTLYSYMYICVNYTDPQQTPTYSPKAIEYPCAGIHQSFIKLVWMWTDLHL